MYLLLVDLFTEGGGGLVGRQCPGSARLYCVGTNLTTLRWSYNGDNIVAIFSPDDSPRTLTTSFPAFISVELTGISQSEDPIFGSFSSILTVDRFHLVQQAVTSIECGDPGTSDIETINLDLVQPSLPVLPVISGIQSIQHAMGSREVKVSWEQVGRKRALFCF